MYDRPQTSSLVAKSLTFHFQHLASFTDSIPMAVMLTDIEGVSVYENSTMRTMLTAHPDGSLRAAIAKRVDAVWCSTKARGATNLAQESSLQLLHGGTYRITSSCLWGEMPPRPCVVAVMVELVGAASLPTSTLRRRYSLTHREVEVARLLADGNTNNEIARELRISVCTARHHTENVMLKLRVSTRAKVARVLALLRCAA